MYSRRAFPSRLIAAFTERDGRCRIGAPNGDAAVRHPLQGSGAVAPRSASLDRICPRTGRSLSFPNRQAACAVCGHRREKGASWASRQRTSSSGRTHRSS